MTLTPIQLDATAYGGGLRHAPHEHGELHLTLVLGGSLEERIHGRIFRAGPLSVLAKDPGVRHADDFSPGGALLARLSVAGRGLGELAEHPHRATPWRWSREPAAVRPFLRLLNRRASLGPDVAADDPDLLDVLAAMTARPDDLPDGGVPPRWIRDVADRVRNDWRPGLKVGAMARDAGVHPVYLARAYRRWYGTGLGSALRRERIERAATRLAADAGRVSAVAHRTGYADQAHLCREFRRTTAMPPGAYRRLVTSLAWDFACAAPEVSKVQAGARPRGQVPCDCHHVRGRCIADSPPRPSAP